MRLLEKYNVNINEIEVINLAIRASEKSNWLYRIEEIELYGIPDDIQDKINFELIDKGNCSNELEIQNFLAKELGLDSIDLIMIV